MNKQELTEAFASAQVAQKEFDYNALGLFDGFGLPEFKPVHCTRAQVAVLIRWQCCRFDGTMDAENLDEIGRIGRKKFIIIG